mmetsp:Transcript_8682/g.19887  ORF Transcript_8682/g.19887 Transcript_8682/m.19887 type:complete len:254 (-) Transcript_8682:100-861(-)|eukprot:CAMPEP_0197910060 /NCGR_PEP_ID=MMETSP1439-20131203/70190_1 /TAXON_ID=66791 /ORGANISM="Gonyaulax spinifera, Strain CCMP409" /LENGTH=253 /DNA_ID=CAMNT_0043531679 /DNA_START=53 /DNA_END=814 /DNA_ORIENTATION=+
MTSLDDRVKEISTGTGAEQFTVHDNVWTREEAADGRTYFFNRATGASQWHVPNELYEQRAFDAKPRLAEEDHVAMPGIAKAVLNVDCVTEFSPKSNTVVSALRKSIDDKLKKEAAEKHLEGYEEDQGPVKVLHVTFLKAQGLRDADFMPGQDKSDPFVQLEILGKPDAKLRTSVIQDCLDPEWNEAFPVPLYSPGDVVILTVFDEDPYEGEEDDLLGRVMLADEDLEGTGPAEFRLEETSGVESFLTVQFEYL